MTGFAGRLTEARKKKGLTQDNVAEKLGVSFQSVSLWERGMNAPDISKLPELSALLGVSIDWLLKGAPIEALTMDFQNELSDRLFDENRMYTYVKTYAATNHLYQTATVLPYVRELHKGQVRKGKDQVPFIYHPLLIACHALALGLDDDLVSTALLHDVCEDCGIAAEDLPVNEQTKHAVSLLTNPGGKDDAQLEEYYAGIATDPIATMVKLLDRCNNISCMATGFSPEKIVAYIKETEKWAYPLLRKAKDSLPMYSNQIFLIKYHITSVVETIKHQAK